MGRWCGRSRDLKARGLKVTLYPFVMMDVPGDNRLADPWTGAASQPAYPWRGRITCDPGPGRVGTAEGTAAAEAQVAAFAGTCTAADFIIEGDAVVYRGLRTGPAAARAAHGGAGPRGRAASTAWCSAPNSSG